MDAHILLVDGDEPSAVELRTRLEEQGHRVTVRHNGVNGLEAARAPDVDLLIPELVLSGMDGLRMLRTLRHEGSRLPVLILTVRRQVSDKVRALEAGADDYVTKPFAAPELLARVNALLRRARAPNHRAVPEAEGWRGPTLEGPFRFGDVVVDPGSRTVRRNGEELSVAPKEFELLVALLRRNGMAATRKELLREVWHHRGTASSRTVDTHVGTLRQKIEEDPRNPRHLHTVRKVGYRLQP